LRERARVRGDLGLCLPRHLVPPQLDKAKAEAQGAAAGASMVISLLKITVEIF